MYLSHFNLSEKPFELSPNPKFLWLGETHKEALAILRYGIRENKGFIMLIGDVGTGKTTLVNGLLETLDEHTIIAQITDPGLEKIDFFNFLAHCFELDKNFASKGEFLVHFIHFLHKAHAENKQVLLIIDEAQRLSPEMLEEIRMLSNIEKQHTKLLDIFLLGQNELNDTLAAPQNRALRQRITTIYTIEALPKSEVEAYLKFRLKVAGCDRKLFKSGAVRAVKKYSKGNPRLINVICDQALLTAYAAERKHVDGAIVRECVRELNIVKNNRIKKGPSARERTAKTPKALRPAALLWQMIPVYAILLILLFVAVGPFYYPSWFEKHLWGIKRPTTRPPVPQQRIVKKISPADAAQQILRTPGPAPASTGPGPDASAGGVIPEEHASLPVRPTDAGATLPDDREIGRKTPDARESVGVGQIGIAPVIEAGAFDGDLSASRPADVPQAPRPPRPDQSLMIPFLGIPTRCSMKATRVSDN